MVERASDEEGASGGKKEVVRDGVEEMANDCVQEVASDGMDEGISVGACDDGVELGCRDECNIEDGRVEHVEWVKELDLHCICKQPYSSER